MTRPRRGDRAHQTHIRIHTKMDYNIFNVVGGTGAQPSITPYRRGNYFDRKRCAAYTSGE